MGPLGMKIALLTAVVKSFPEGSLLPLQKLFQPIRRAPDEPGPAPRAFRIGSLRSIVQMNRAL